MFGDDIVAYLPERVRPFAEQLKQFPTGYEKWIYAAALPSETYQGDVFTGVPFVSIDEQGGPVRADLLGMVVSNTCDTQPNQGDFVLIAPITALSDYRENAALVGAELDNYIRALTENKISNLMFLPGGQNIPDSFVDFGNLCSVSSEYFHRECGGRRLISLSWYGHYFLLVKLAYHFTRPEAAEAKRA